MSWTQDLTMGMKFAVGGGREGWIRTLLTAVGVGLGVALLLITTAIPSALAARNAREDNRNDFGAVMIDKPAHDTMLLGVADTVYKGADVRGRLVRGEGPDAPLPPGTGALPGDGEMLVSSALRRLLASDKGALLRERLPYRITGTVTDAGLTGPNELAYYAGDNHLTLEETGVVRRITAFAHMPPQEAMDPVLKLLVMIIFVVLLMPVGVFIAGAVRFGSDSRDRRLAALRLVGTDSRMTRRIAAGEALAGSLLGVVFGAGFFLIGRAFVGDIDVAGINLFPADLNPSAALAVLVALAVPAAAVAVTLLALRGVVIEPLGVVRTSVQRRRRVWWRVLPPVAGLALLVPMLGKGRTSGHFNSTLVIGGSVLLLIGVTALLPWLIEAVVNRLGGGTTAWQLAVRRLQMTSGTAARLVNGIAVAVAGAIALQMLFAGIDGDYTKETGADTSRVQMVVQSDFTKGRTADALRATHGVRKVLSVSRATAGGRRTLSRPAICTPATARRSGYWPLFRPARTATRSSPPVAGTTTSRRSPSPADGCLSTRPSATGTTAPSRGPSRPEPARCRSRPPRPAVPARGASCSRRGRCPRCGTLPWSTRTTSRSTLRSRMPSTWSVTVWRRSIR